MKTFHIVTFGCQMNEYDSLVIKEMLVKNGFIFVKDPHDAEIIIVNGCVVRQKPEEKAIEVLKYYRNRGKFMVATGCLAQKDKDLLLNFADLVMGPMDYDGLLDLIGHRGVYADYTKYRDMFYRYALDREYVSFSEFVTIMTGCDNFCSYCVVPYTRGREISRPLKDIKDEVEKLLEKGVKEITLIGQNVNSYFYNGVGFKDLLEHIAKLGVRRLRFTTSHPRDISYAVFRVMSKYENIMPWLHLPLQSGSTKLLKEMGRGYTKEEFLNIVKMARRVLPDMVISTDIMVGYPSETEEDFEQTLDVVRKVRFDYAYMFIYSPRKPSLAFYRYKEGLPGKIATKRHRKLVDAVQNIVLEKRKAMLGKEYELLIDGYSKKDSNVSRGKTKGNITVVINKKIPEGTFVKVKVSDVKGATPMGRLIEK